MPDKVNASSDVMSDEQAVSALQGHALDAARRANEKLGAVLSVANMELFLHEPECLRVPTELRFDAAPLSPHQFAQPVFSAAGGQRRCLLHIHPRYADRPETHAPIVAYMAAAINYGAAATSELCEEFGAVLMGMTREAFYDDICRIADMRSS